MLTDPRLNQRVRVKQDYYEAKFRGRAGSIVKLCRTIADYCYVHLDIRPRERVRKIEMLPLKHLEDEMPPVQSVGEEGTSP